MKRHGASAASKLTTTCDTSHLDAKYMGSILFAYKWLLLFIFSWLEILVDIILNWNIISCGHQIVQYQIFVRKSLFLIRSWPTPSSLTKSPRLRPLWVVIGVLTVSYILDRNYIDGHHEWENMTQIFKQSSFASQCYGQSDSPFGLYSMMTILAENWLIFNSMDRNWKELLRFFFLFIVSQSI